MLPDSLYFFLSLILQLRSLGVGEMAQWLRTHTAITENPSLVSSTHVRCLTDTCSPAQGDPKCLSPCRYLHLCVRISTRRTHTH